MTGETELLRNFRLNYYIRHLIRQERKTDILNVPFCFGVCGLVYKQTFSDEVANLYVISNLPGE